MYLSSLTIFHFFRRGVSYCWVLSFYCCLQSEVRSLPVSDGSFISWSVGLLVAICLLVTMCVT